MEIANLLINLAFVLGVGYSLYKTIKWGKKRFLKSPLKGLSLDQYINGYDCDDV